MNEPVPQSQEPKQLGMAELLNHPLVQELAVPYIKQEVLGINHKDKDVTKKGFGRALYALRDFMQGTYWVFIIFIFSMMLTIIIFLALRKVLGV